MSFIILHEFSMYRDYLQDKLSQSNKYLALIHNIYHGSKWN